MTPATSARRIDPIPSFSACRAAGVDELSLQLGAEQDGGEFGVAVGL
jgi:hypothetical protein